MLFYLLILCLLIAVGLAVYYRLLSFYSRLPDLGNSLTISLQTAGDQIDERLRRFSPEMAESIRNFAVETWMALLRKIGTACSSRVMTMVKGIPHFLFMLGTVAVAGCYFAADYRNIVRFADSCLTRRSRERVLRLRRILKTDVFSVIRGYILLSLVAFVLLCIGFVCLRVGSPVAVAAVTALIDVLPVFGTGTVLIPWAVISLIGGEIRLGLGLLILYALIAAIRSAIEPKIIGKRVGLHPLLSLMAMLAGLKLFGVAGMIVLPVLCGVAWHYALERAVQSGRFENRQKVCPRRCRKRRARIECSESVSPRPAAVIAERAFGTPMKHSDARDRNAKICDCNRNGHACYQVQGYSASERLFGRNGTHEGTDGRLRMRLRRDCVGKPRKNPENPQRKPD